MPISEARKKANRKWDAANREKYWRATIMIPVEDKDAIQARAAETGQSLSEYIRDLIQKDMNDERPPE